jgi:RNA polymerase sigma-70 factor (ECF subfamily)
MASERVLGAMQVRDSSRAALESALDRMLADNGPALRRLAASYANSSDREDLLQEIAIAVWRALPGFRGECSERTFLFRIAHNRCITHISRRRPTVSLDDTQIEPEDPSPGTEAALSQVQERERLLRAVRRLPMIYREVTVLVLEGLDYGAIAEIVGISESNVGVRLNRARRQLKTLIEEKS